MKAIAYFLSVFSVAVLLTSCDVVENPIPLKDPYKPLSDSLALDSVETANGFKPVVQRVLLEDYTGHYCGNCPGASVEARKIKTQYGEKVAVMAVHAGYFAQVRNDGKFTYNFSTPAGEEWATFFKIQSNPNGMVNRTPRSGATATYQGVANWAASVANQLAQNPKADLNVTTLYNAATRGVQIKVRTKYLNALQGKYHLGVYITEDGIVKMQKNYGAAAGGDPAYQTGDIPDYVHPHALRAAVDGTWGRINKENPAANDEVPSYFTYTLDKDWNEAKCSVIAFIYNDATKEIIQVDEEHLTVQ